MAKSENSKDKLKLEIVQNEINSFKKLIAGHRKLLAAIGNL